MVRDLTYAVTCMYTVYNVLATDNLQYNSKRSELKRALM